MSSNYKPEVLDEKVTQKALERYYIRNIFDSDCTHLEYGVCLLDEKGDQNLNLNAKEAYCYQLQEMMEDYHQYRQNVLADESQEYLEQLIGIFEEEAIDILEFNCGHFDIVDGIHRLCIASKSKFPAYATYRKEECYCPSCQSRRERSELLEKKHFL